MGLYRASAVVALLALCACRPAVRAEAKALAGRGAQTGARLAESYEGLARDTVDTWELTAFRRGFLGLPDPKTDTRAVFEQRYKALRARARLARRLANVYEELGNLADYDAGAQLIRSVDALHDEMRTVVDTPLDKTRTNDALDAVIRGITTWKQNRDLKAGARLLGEIVAGVDALFRAEREIYRDIARDRAENARQVAVDLVKAKEVVSATLLDRVLSEHGLRWPDAKQPFTDERTIAGVLEILEARSRTFEARSQDEAESIADALASLRDAHQRLAAQRMLP